MSLNVVFEKSLGKFLNYWHFAMTTATLKHSRERLNLKIILHIFQILSNFLLVLKIIPPFLSLLFYHYYTIIKKKKVASNVNNNYLLQSLKDFYDSRRERWGSKPFPKMTKILWALKSNMLRIQPSVKVP